MVFDGNYLDKMAAAEWAHKFDPSEMSQVEFEAIEEGWRNFNPEVGPGHLNLEELSADYREFRDKIVLAWKDVDAAGKSLRTYQYHLDVKVGLTLYTFLRINGFNQIYAETDDWWRFITVRLFPDLTYMRYPADDEVRINRKRFFEHTRRIWLKTLWWYVHLSWQGDENRTEAVLEKLGTDAISQIIERPGRGYRPEVFRAIALKCATESSWCGSKPFQKVMARHSIYNASFEPTLFRGGLSGYADHIFSETKVSAGI